MDFCFHDQSRSLIMVTGADSANFLQGLISNDIRKACQDGWLYALWLTPQGRIVADLFIQRTPEGFLLDVPSTQQDVLMQKMHTYRLRSQVEISKYPAAVLLSSQEGSKDPRHLALGCRKIVNAPSTIAQAPEFYRNLCIKLKVVDFHQHLTPEKFFPHELGMNERNAIDYTKGCYIGQEVVARVEYQGQVRKKLYIVKAMGVGSHKGSSLFCGTDVRLLPKLAHVEEFEEGPEHRTDRRTMDVHEDPSTGPTYKLPTGVEFPKKSIGTLLNSCDAHEPLALALLQERNIGEQPLSSADGQLFVICT